MPTKKQHYIPRMLLKRFTTFRVPMRKSFIYQYDKKNNIERMIDVADACRKNNLYELRDEFGLIKDEERNSIEKWFSFMESIWNKILDKIDQHKYLNSREQSVLSTLVVFQLMRTPEIMQFMKQWIYDTFNDMGRSFTNNQSDRYVKLASFGWGEISPKQKWILDLMFNKLLVGKYIVIYHSDATFILNGNRPVFTTGSIESVDINYCKCYLPVSKHYCLGLVEGNNNELYIEAPNWFVELINSHNFLNAGRFIYSSESLINIKDKYYVDFANQI